MMTEEIERTRFEKSAVGAFPEAAWLIFDREGDGYAYKETDFLWEGWKMASRAFRGDAGTLGADPETETRWQERIYEACKKVVGTDADYLIDGGGTDSGDALDFTMTEIWQAFHFLEEKAESALAHREAQDDARKIVWRPEVEPLRRMMMAKFSDQLSMEEIAGRCYRAAEILNPTGVSAEELAESPVTDREAKQEPAGHS